MKSGDNICPIWKTKIYAILNRVFTSYLYTMKNRYTLTLIFALLVIGFHSVAQKKDHLDIDIKELVSNADLHYTQPVKKGEEGMPVGNGRMGSLVWTTPQALHLQVNRVDIFGNDASSNNFYERNTDYCGGAGSVDIDFFQSGEAAFSGNSFSQHLSCYDGVVTVLGKGIKLEIITWNEQDVIAIRASGEKLGTYQLLSHLRMLRPPLVKTGDHTAESYFGTNKDCSLLVQKFFEGNFYCGSSLAMSVTGSGSHIALENKTDLRTELISKNDTVVFYISSTSGFEPSEDLSAKAIKQLDEARELGFGGMLKSNREWWKAFWEKGFVLCTVTMALQI